MTLLNWLFTLEQDLLINYESFRHKIRSYRTQHWDYLHANDESISLNFIYSARSLNSSKLFTATIKNRPGKVLVEVQVLRGYLAVNLIVAIALFFLFINRSEVDFIFFWIGLPIITAIILAVFQFNLKSQTQKLIQHIKKVTNSTNENL